MTFRWSRWSPQLALLPAASVTLVAFIGAIIWTIISLNSAYSGGGAGSGGVAAVLVVVRETILSSAFRDAPAPMSSASIAAAVRVMAPPAWNPVSV